MGKQKARPKSAKQAQTQEAREAKARNRSSRVIDVFVENEYKRGMVEGRWHTRADACRDLQSQADTVTDCLRMSSFSPLRVAKKCSDPDRNYSRRLYLAIGEIERELAALGIRYPARKK